MSHSGIVHYHRHTPEPQSYRIDADGVTGRLVSPELLPTPIELHDVRDDAVDTSFEADGIGFFVAPTDLDLTAAGWEARYAAELTDLLRRELGADTVRVFDHTLRVDDPAAVRRPARNVHTDYSPEGARVRLDTLLGADTAAEWAAGHYAFVNVWRPVSDVVRSAPLGFVRPRTVAPADWVSLDLVYPDRVGQILGLVPNPAHEWVYQSRMTSRELAVFNIYDNRGRPAVAHSAVDLREPTPAGGIRRSLETRTVIRFPTALPTQEHP